MQNWTAFLARIPWRMLHARIPDLSSCQEDLRKLKPTKLRPVVFHWRDASSSDAPGPRPEVCRKAPFPTANSAFSQGKDQTNAPKEYDEKLGTNHRG